MTIWIHDRPPTKSEVADHECAWVSGDNGNVWIATGYSVRFSWELNIIAWLPIAEPEPYVPEKSCPACGRRM